MKGKVKMDLVEELSSRKRAYNKRKETLLKKVEEISTLCGVEAGLIMFSEFKEDDGRSVTWPPDAEQVQEVVNKFKFASAMDMTERKTEDMDSLVKQRLAKEKVKLEKLQLENENEETRNMLLSKCLAGNGLTDLSVVELNRLNRFIDEKLSSLHERMSDLKQEQAIVNSAQKDNFVSPDPEIYRDTEPLLNENGVEDHAGPSGTKEEMGTSGAKGSSNPVGARDEDA